MCIVCCEPITCYAVGACGHKDLCATCVYRRRRLYAQCICAICKDPLDIVLFTHDSTTTFPATNRALEAVLHRPGVEFIPDPPDQAQLFKQNVEDYTRTAAEHAAAAAASAARAAALAEANARRAAELARLNPLPTAENAFPALPSAPAGPPSSQTRKAAQKKRKKGAAAAAAAGPAAGDGAEGAEGAEGGEAAGHKRAPERLSHEPGVVCMEPAIAARIRGLSEYRCPVCAERPRFASLEALKGHLHETHQLYYCDICLADRKVFLEEQVLMRASELALHMTQWDGGISYSLQKMMDEQDQHAAAKGAQGARKGAGDDDSDSKRTLLKWKPMLRSMATGHPLCKFCNTRFYGVDQLYDHLIHTHISCPICEKRGNPWQFFRDLKELVAHYDKKHFLCHYPGCMMGFATSFDLKVHQGTEHGVNVASSGTHGGRLVLETHFNVRRAARNGEGIVDDDEYHLGTLMDPEQYREAQQQQRLRAAQARAHSPASQALANMRALTPPATTDFFAQHQGPAPQPQEPRPKGKKGKKAAQKAAPEEAADVDVARPVARVPQSDAKDEKEGKEGEAPSAGHKRLAIERPHPAAGSQAAEAAAKKEDGEVVEKVAEKATEKATEKAASPAPSARTPSPQPQKKTMVVTESAKVAPAAATAKAAAAPAAAPATGGFCNTEGMSVQEKNQLMVTAMRSLVSEAAFQDFKQYSAKYRAGAITGREYYDRFFATFGTSAQTRELFSLLASLLPDPEKRMELVELHTVHCAPPPAPRGTAAGTGRKKRKGKGAGRPPAGIREEVPGFGRGEYRMITSADTSDFPSLAAGAHAQPASARGKRGKQVLFHAG